MNGGAKCRKLGGLGWLGAPKVMGNVINLIERVLLPIQV